MQRMKKCWEHGDSMAVHTSELEEAGAAPKASLPLPTAATHVSQLLTLET